MKIHTFIKVAMTAFLASALISVVFAQEPVNSPIALGNFKHFSSRKVACPLCARLTGRYNDARDDLMDSDDYLDEVDADIARSERDLTALESKITDLKRQFVRHPSTSLNQQLKTAENEHKSLSQKYGRYDREYSAEERQNKQLEQELDSLGNQLDFCEKTYCHLSMTNPIHQMIFLHYMMNIEVGLFLANINNSRRGYLDSPEGLFTGSHSQNNTMLGPQLRLLFGSPQHFQTFVLLNALTIFNATNQLLRVRSDGFSNYDSR